jgi:hypothetical protein
MEKEKSPGGHKRRRKDDFKDKGYDYVDGFFWLRTGTKDGGHL